MGQRTSDQDSLLLYMGHRKVLEKLLRTAGPQRAVDIRVCHIGPAVLIARQDIVLRGGHITVWTWRGMAEKTMDNSLKILGQTYGIKSIMPMVHVQKLKYKM